MSINAPAGGTVPRDDLVGAYSEYATDMSGFIAEIMLPGFEVARRTGTYGVIPLEAHLALLNTERAANAETVETGWSPESDTFSLTEYANKEHVNEVTADIYRDWFEAEEIATQRVQEINTRWYEYIVSAMLINETNFPASGVTGTTISTPWDNASGVPITDIQSAIQTMEDNYGVTPNLLEMSSYTFRKMLTCTQVAARLTDHYGGAMGLIEGVLPVEKLQVILGVEKIVVANTKGAVYNGANPGATPSISKFWNEDYAFLARVESGRDLRRPQLGRTLKLANWGGVNIDSWITNDPPGQYVRVREHKGAKRMATAVGHLFKNTKT